MKAPTPLAKRRIREMHDQQKEELFQMMSTINYINPREAALQREMKSIQASSRNNASTHFKSTFRTTPKCNNLNTEEAMAMMSDFSLPSGLMSLSNMDRAMSGMS